MSIFNITPAGAFTNAMEANAKAQARHAMQQRRAAELAAAHRHPAADLAAQRRTTILGAMLNAARDIVAFATRRTA